MFIPQGTLSIEEYTLPSAEALLGGTLALMTGLSQAQCAQHRALMAHKIVANLASLAQSPQLSAGFRHLLDSLRQRWLAQQCSQSLQGVAPGVDSVWHVAPTALQ
jgi:hypothetical protein